MSSKPERVRLEDQRGVQEAGLVGEDLGYDADGLLGLISNPTVPAARQNEVDPDQVTSSGANQFSMHNSNSLDDIWVWEGRPVWATVFSQMKESAVKRNLDLDTVLQEVDTGKKVDEGRKGDVGVCFCGSAIIGGDLSTNVKRFSDSTCEFRLNQEYF